MTSILAAWAGLLLAGTGGPVTNVSILPALTRTEIVIAVAGEVQYRDFTMEAPARLVVDLMGAQHALGQGDYLGVDRGGIVALRTSQYSEDIVRVVLEMDELVGYTITAGDGFIRVSMEGSGVPFDPWSAREAAPAPTPAFVPSVSDASVRPSGNR